MKTKQARALIDLPVYGCRINDVIDADPDLVDQLCKDGYADSSKAAIKAALEAGGEVHKHTPAKAEPDPEPDPEPAEA